MLSDSLIKSLMSRGEEFFTQLSNALLSNPAFVEVLKKGVAAKEKMDEQVAAGLRAANVATRKDLRKLEQRIAALESDLAEAKEAISAATAAPKRRVARRG
jgi:polyhydroxyalkanoate synthesis regulator phasin